MVSTPGLTRSNGRVSHAGNSSTRSSPRKTPRSWASRSASVEVGTASTIGRRLVSRDSPAVTSARAASGTARVAELRPSTWASAGSSRSAAGRSMSGPAVGAPGAPPKSWGRVS